MPHPGWALLIVSLALVASGCRRNPPPGSSARESVSGRPALPRVAPSLPPPGLPALAALPTEQAVAQLIAAHYDPSRLGLRELGFEVDLSLPQNRTRALATASWRSGQSPSVKIKSVERQGRTELAPADPGVGRQIWTALQYQTQHLLDGVGSGFLSQRLQEWQKRQGQSKLEGGKLILTFNDQSEETVVTVGPGWVVQKVENRSPRKVYREMEYQHRLEQGRNLVTLARLHVRVEEGAGLPPGEVSILRSQEGLSFRIDYADAGGYLLARRLRKTSSRGDEALLELTYTAVK